MHRTLALLIAINWHNVWEILPVRIVAVSGFLTTLLQLVKLKLPGISGWWAVTINVILAATGVISLTALTGAQNILTVTTLANIIVASLAAAGIHSTARSLRAQDAAGTDNAIAKGLAEPPTLPSQSGLTAGGYDGVNVGRKLPIALVFVALMTILPLGCGTAVTATTPPTALAPGYLNADDQKLGQSLAGVHAFIEQEKINYAKLPPQLQEKEKPYLIAAANAANIADAAYTAYHAGTQTLAQAQAAEKKAETAEANLATQKGGK